MNRYQKYVLAYGVGATILWVTIWLGEAGFDPEPPPYEVMLAVIVLGTAALIVAGRTVRLGRAALIGVGVGAGGATLLTYAVVDSYGCCMFAYTAQRGFPMPWWTAFMESDVLVPPARLLEYMDLHASDVSTRFGAFGFLLSAVVWSYGLALIVLGVRYLRSSGLLTGNRKVA